MRLDRRNSQYGFTLVEMIVVIVITGILGGVVAVFLRAPIQGYVDSARRAELVDIADTALRRIGHDIRSAVPNSVRVLNPAGINAYIEFLPTIDGGRYRAVAAPTGTVQCGGTLAQDILDFSQTDSCFEIIGAPITFAAGDQIVVGSTQSSGNPPYDSTAAGVLRAYTGATAVPVQAVNFTATPGLAQFPAWAQVPSQRFDVVPGTEQAVTYSCENVGTAANGDGTGKLMRYWAYGFNAAQVAPPLGGKKAMLASGVSTCKIVYDNFSQRAGLVAITLELTRGGESVRLYHEIHVNNEP